MNNNGELGEIVEIDAVSLRKTIEERGFTLREVNDLMSEIYVNPDYLSKRLKKGSMPICVLTEVCRIIGKQVDEYAIPYDLSGVPSYQMIEELRKRGEIE